MQNAPANVAYVTCIGHFFAIITDKCDEMIFTITAFFINEKNQEPVNNNDFLGSSVVGLLDFSDLVGPYFLSYCFGGVCCTRSIATKRF